MAFRVLLAALALFLCALAWAQPRLIRPGDRLKVACPQAAALDGEHLVAPDGVVQLPLLGIVEVGGKSSEEAKAHLEGLLVQERLAKAPSVTLSIVGAEERQKPRLPAPVKQPAPKKHDPQAAPVQPVFGKIRIVGAVEAETEVDAIPGMTLDKALSRTRPLPEADLGAVLVTRPDGTAVSYDCAEKAEAVPLGAGDVVEIPVFKEPRSVTVLGAVADSGAVEFYPGLTVADAVDKCGGISVGAQVERVTLVRAGRRDDLAWPDEARTTRVQAGDAVEVIAIGASSSVSVAGAVRRPGYYVVGQGTTLGMLVRASGGAVAGADLRRVALLRDGQKKPVYVDYLAIEQGLQGDVPLGAGDRVVVEGPGKRRYGPGAAAGVVGLFWFVLGR